jgi:hypothetical protein
MYSVATLDRLIEFSHGEVPVLVILKRCAAEFIQIAFHFTLCCPTA